MTGAENRQIQGESSMNTEHQSIGNADENQTVSNGAGGIGYQVIKRMADVVLSACALLVIGPVILLVALIIFLDDPHASPFFSQVRIGLNGRPFRLYKLRSMVSNAEELLESLKERNEMDGPAFKIENDPRITRIGRFIRKCSIDELPQFWNVLKGDMSIVGPRPPLPKEVAQYTPYQMRRLSVRPGLTCIWQTQPKRNEMRFSKWIELDLEYIDHRSLWLDFKLILKTARCMMAGEGR